MGYYAIQISFGHIQLINYLIRLYVRLAFLQAKPQDVPASPPILVGSVLVMLASYMAAVLSQLSFIEAVQRAVFEAAFVAIFIYGVLVLREQKSRFVQTYTAICGTSIVFNLCYWPILLIDAGNDFEGAAKTIIELAETILFVWGIAVTAHIYQHAFDLKRWGGVAVALLSVILAIAIMVTIFPHRAVS